MNFSLTVYSRSLIIKKAKGPAILRNTYLARVCLNCVCDYHLILTETASNKIVIKGFGHR